MEEKSAGVGAANLKAVAGYSAVVFALYIGFRMYALTKEMVGGATLYKIFMFFSWVFQGGAAYHSLDYSMGLLPRALTGQILSFFTGGALTGRAAAIYLLAAFAITYGLFSVIVGMLIEKAVRTENYPMAMFPFLFILAPLSVWARTFFDMNFDTFMLLFALLAFLLLLRSKNEKLLWLVPLLSCLGILANYAYALLFFPLLFALLYYEYIQSGLKKSGLARLIVTTGSSAALGLYMMVAPFYSELMHRIGLYKYDYDQAIALLEGRVGRALDPHELLYISHTIYGKIPCGDLYTYVPIKMGEFGAFSPIYGWFQPRYILCAALLCLPVCVFSLLVWRRMAKGEAGFLKRSPYYLFMLAPLIILPGFAVFSDIDRLVWSALLTQLLLVIYVFFKKGEDAAFERMKEITKRDKLALACIVLFGLAILLPLLVFKDDKLLNPVDVASLEEMARRLGVQSQ